MGIKGIGDGLGFTIENEFAYVNLGASSAAATVGDLVVISFASTSIDSSGKWTTCANTVADTDWQSDGAAGTGGSGIFGICLSDQATAGHKVKILLRGVAYARCNTTVSAAGRLMHPLAGATGTACLQRVTSSTLAANQVGKLVAISLEATSGGGPGFLTKVYFNGIDGVGYAVGA